jgi:hypothetical protein
MICSRSALSRSAEQNINLFAHAMLPDKIFERFWAKSVFDRALFGVRLRIY